MNELPLIDITGQVEVAVATLICEQSLPWRRQGNATGYVPFLGLSPATATVGAKYGSADATGTAATYAATAESTTTSHASPSRSDSPFFGTCFNCNNVGHWLAECPSGPRCYNCWELGHMTRECQNPKIAQPAHIPPPTQRAQTPRPESCQICNSQGVTSRNCTQCSPNLSAWMGNLHLDSRTE